MNKFFNPILAVWLIAGIPARTMAQENGPLLYPQQVEQFYRLNEGRLFWLAAGNEAADLRTQLTVLLDSAYRKGLINEKYHLSYLKANSSEIVTDTAVQQQIDRYYTDAAFALLKDIYTGFKEQPWVSFDAVSEKYRERDNEQLLQCLLLARTASQLMVVADELEPHDSLYSTLKNEYQRFLLKNRADSVRLLRLSMNYYRWIRHFHFDQLIVVNLAAARLWYFEQDKQVLQMKAVVGKTSTPSPRFAAWCDQAILYPYWYVPRSITFKEYMPLIKGNPSWLDAMNMQVIDGKGNVVNHHTLNWTSFHSGYFPYTIRQSTGCDNALGVIKFNIITPFGVYLHDTNKKSAFRSANRYFSHGCIRLEDPFSLGFQLLNHQLDTAFLQSCYKQQKPVFETLPAAVPVFTVYMPAWPVSPGKIQYYKDTYRLLK